MKKVLVTGLDSFTGHYIHNALTDDGYDVFGFCRKNLKNAKNITIGELSNTESIRASVMEVRPDYVIHLAAVSSVQHDDKLDIYRTNVMGTLNLLEAIKSSGLEVEQVVVASSANIYGNKSEGMIEENHPAKPVNEYAASKAAMELAVKPYGFHLPITIVRPFNYTGVLQSNSFLIPKIVSHFAGRKTVLELGNTDISRDFSDVRDIASYYSSLLGNEKSVGKTINFCSGESLSLDQVLSYLSEIANFSPEIKINPAFVRENDVKALWGDNTLLTETTGKTRRFTFIETLQWMYDFSIK